MSTKHITYSPPGRRTSFVQLMVYHKVTLVTMEIPTKYLHRINDHTAYIHLHLVTGTVIALRFNNRSTELELDTGREECHVSSCRLEQFDHC